MGKEAGSAPQAVDPNVTIPLQAKYNKEAFDQALGASRVNQFSPTGSTTWQKTGGRTFDQAGWDKTFADWRQRYLDLGKEGDQFDREGFRIDPRYNYDEILGKAPNEADFWKDTPEQWTQTTSLSPNQQAIFNANEQSQLGQAQLLDALTKRVGDSTAGPVDYSSAPNAVGTVDAANLDTNRASVGNLARVGNGADSIAPDVLAKLSGFSDKIAGLDPRAFNTEAADALYRQSTRYLDPERDRQQQALEARLAEQGFTPGTPGYQQAMQVFQDTNNRSYADARDRALTLGTSVGRDQFGSSLSGINAQIAAALSGGQLASSENQNVFNRGLQAAGFNNSADMQEVQSQNSAADASNAAKLQQQQASTNSATFQNDARARAIAELLQKRAQPLNELSAMRSGTQVNVPSIGSGQAAAPNLAAPNVQGAYDSQYAGQANAYNAAVGSDNALMSGLFGLGGAALGGPLGGTLGTALGNWLKRPGGP